MSVRATDQLTLCVCIAKNTFCKPVCKVHNLRIRWKRTATTEHVFELFRRVRLAQQTNAPKLGRRKPHYSADPTSATFSEEVFQLVPI